MKKVRAWILAIVLVILGIAMMTLNTTDVSSKPEDLAEISYQDLKNNAIYYVEDLYILDTFAMMEDDDLLYMAVIFEDKNGEWTLLNMPVNEDDEIWDDVNDYMDDDSQGFGDLKVDGYVKTETNTNVEGKLHGYFDEWVEYFEDETDASVAVTTSLRFNYICDEDGDPQEIVKSEKTVLIVVGVVLMVLAAVILYFGALRKPKQKAAMPYTVPTYTPQQPTYTAPQQPAYSAPNGETVAEQLNRYKALMDAGVMTEEEYESKRRELLKQ